MQSHYLLPCACGNKIEVDGGQAGLTARCACGAEVPVPTMRGLEALERVGPQASPSQKPSADWGTRQGIIFLGLVIALAASIGGAYEWYKIPTKPELADDISAIVRGSVDQLTLEALWEDWHNLQTALDDRGEVPPMAAYMYLEAEGRRRLKILGGVLVFGLAVAALGLFGKSAARKPQRTRRP
ncbi:MAG TPA: hypothetical protein VMV69_01065 [Pirellulales bacterium]|nr:hypothetical protein [Pirellulales bacterium]